MFKRARYCVRDACGRRGAKRGGGAVSVVVDIQQQICSWRWRRPSAIISLPAEGGPPSLPAARPRDRPSLTVLLNSFVTGMPSYLAAVRLYGIYVNISNMFVF